ncbi:uncharacterized protein LOC131942799 isoform X2 [Physella acuta]|nr:uncharacterized protein LOC131942799 isoform X2 [Physella acuta]
MTPTTDFKSPHEEVVTITEPVQSGSKNPTKIAKLSFVFFLASGIINWYFFIIDSEFYNFHSRSINFFYKQTSINNSGMKLLIVLGNTIAYGVIYLQIFTCRSRGSKVTAMIAACICIVTSTFWLVALILMNTKANQPRGHEKPGIYFVLIVAAHYAQFITGLRMVVEMINIT